jgi:hypothetical protein
MKKSILIFQRRSSPELYSVETVEVDGAEYFKLPVVMMRQGVFRGSAGPLRHLMTNYLGNVGEWQGVPVTISHPSDSNGNFVSANTEGVQIVGYVHQPKVEDAALKAFVMLNKQKLEEVNIQAYNQITNGLPIDVSIGIFASHDGTAGVHDGVNYVATVTHSIPDHLAILPNEEGACSWNHGCGIRNNNNSLNIVNMEKTKKPEVNLDVYEEGFRKTVTALQNLLDSKDNGQATYYLEEAFPDHFIYYVRTSNREAPKYYKQSYSLENDNVVLSGEPSEVFKKVEYTTNSVGTPEPEKTETPCCKELIGKVVAAHSNLGMEDEEWLSRLGNEKLMKILPTETSVELNLNSFSTTLAQSIDTVESIYPVLTVNAANVVKEALELREQSRKELVSAVVAFSKDWSEEELDNMPTNTLKKIHSMIPTSGTVNNARHLPINTNAGVKEEVDPESILIP